LKIKESDHSKLEHINFEEIFNKTIEIIVGDILETIVKITADFSVLKAIIFNTIFKTVLKSKLPDRKPIVHIQTKLVDKKITMIVSDNGLGIDFESYAHELFGMYKTFHRHKEPKGVGLYLTKTQIEAMNVKIYIESKVDKGSKCIFEF
jgi:light-regulated signal transduction histidine kinase (bacteriophytochrome)